MQTYIVALALLASLASCQGSCLPVASFGRRLQQSNTAAQATAIENLSNQTTNQVANASSSAIATSTSLTPLPRKCNTDCGSRPCCFEQPWQTLDSSYFAVRGLETICNRFLGSMHQGSPLGASRVLIGHAKFVVYPILVQQPRHASNSIIPTILEIYSISLVTLWTLERAAICASNS